MNRTYEPGSLVVLVGGSGAGKTRFATRRWPATWRLSLDDYRAMATDDMADQSATPVADRSRPCSWTPGSPATSRP